jgi:hypothetical protein
MHHEEFRQGKHPRIALENFVWLGRKNSMELYGLGA